MGITAARPQRLPIRIKPPSLRGLLDRPVYFVFSASAGFPMSTSQRVSRGFESHPLRQKTAEVRHLLPISQGW